MFNSIVVASVSQLRIGTTLKSGKTVSADSNGKAPYILNVVAGKFPNRNILSGTVAEGDSLKLESGKTYLLQVRETETTEFGRQFTLTKIQDITSALEIAKACTELGTAELINVNITTSNSEANVDANAGVRQL